MPVWSAFGVDVISRAVQGAMVFGFLPVVPMTMVSALLMVLVSAVTPRAISSAPTLSRYFKSATKEIKN